MVAVPEATPVTRPPGEVIEAMVSSEDDQPTLSPWSGLWLPSEYVPVAVSWTVLLTATDAEGGVTKIELREGLIKKPLQLHVTHRKKATPAVDIKRILAANSVRRADNIMTIITSQDADPITILF
jgi:hypothetical protein